MWFSWICSGYTRTYEQGKNKDYFSHKYPILVYAAYAAKQNYF